MARNSISNVSALLVVVAQLLALSGCVTTPVTEPMHYHAEKGDNFSETARLPSNASNDSSDECLVQIEHVEDRRNSKESFGSSPYFQKFAESVPQWTKEGFQSLSGENYRMHLQDKNGMKIDAQVMMHVKIHKAYVLHQATSKSANLALSVQYTSSNNTTESKLYRGRYTAINWANSAGEIEGAMNEALSDVLAKIGDDISRYCGS